MTKIFIATLSLLLLAACSRSPQTLYYTITAPEAIESSLKKDKVHAIRVGPVFLPKYLDRPQIVTRTGEHEFQIDDFARWVEPIDDAFLRAFSVTLNNETPDYFVYEFGMGSTLLESTAWLVPVDIRQFDVNDDGVATLSLQWGLEDAQSKRIIYAKTDKFTRPAGGSYSSQSKAMSLLIEDFAREVARVIKATPRPEPQKDEANK